MSNSAEPAVGSDDEENDDDESTSLGPVLRKLLDSSSTAGIIRPSLSDDSLLEIAFNRLSPLPDHSPNHLGDHNHYLTSSLEPVATQHMTTAIQPAKRGFEQNASTDWSKKQRTSQSGSPQVTPTAAAVGIVATSASEVTLETRVHTNTSSKKSDSESGRGSYLCGDCGKIKKGHFCEVGKSRAKPPNGINVMTQTATPYCPEGDTWSAAPVPLWRKYMYVGKYKPVSKGLPARTRKKGPPTMLEDSIALAVWLLNKWNVPGTPDVAMKEEGSKSAVRLERKVNGGRANEDSSHVELEAQQRDEPESQNTEAADGAGLVLPAIEPDDVGSSKDDEDENGVVEVVAV